MPRKRQSNSSAENERPNKRRRIQSVEEKDAEVDVSMSGNMAVIANGSSQRRASATMSNVGGILGGRIGSEFDPKFQKGAIVSLTVSNWVTFDSASMNAVPGLNLIMGPNGSGKSSLICAICMGLNGHTKTLGRVDRVCDFIKRGENKARILIELFAGEDETNIFIERTITARSNAWKINGKTAKAGDVTKVVRKMNIKVDNLCQFLAQDRVVEFARLSPEELLLETERAVDGEEQSLLESHENMIKLQTRMLDEENDLKRVESSLVGAREQRNGLETAISNFRSRESMRANLKVVESRQAWKQVEETEEDAKTLDTEVNKFSAQLRDEQRQLRPLRNIITSWERKGTKFATEAKKMQTENAKCTRQLKKHNEKFAEYSSKMSDVRGELKEHHQRAADQQKHRAKLENILEKAHNDIEALGDVQFAADELKRIRVAIKDARNDQRKFKTRLDAIKRQQSTVQNDISHLEVRITNLRDSEKRRADLIYRGRQRRLRQFAEWVNGNRHVFEGDVYGPIIATMDVHNALHAKFLNSAVSERTLYAWVVTKQTDWSMLSREGKKQGMNVIVYLSDNDRMTNYTTKRPMPLAPLRARGASGYLDQVFDAPEIVKCVLCSIATLHKAAYSDNPLSVEERTRLLPSRKGDPNTVQRLYEGTNSWSVRFSSYDSDSATSSSFVRDLRPDDLGLRVTRDVTEETNNALAQLEEHKQTMEDFNRQKSEVQHEEKPIAKEIAQMNKDKEKHSKVQAAFKKLKNKIDRTQQKLEDVNEPIDLDRLKADCDKRIRKLFNQQRATLEKIVENNRLLVDISVRFRENALQRDHAYIESAVVKAREKHLSKHQEKLKNRLREVKAALKQAQRKLEEYLSDAESQFPKDEWEEKWTDEQKNKSHAELTADAEDLKSRIACVLCNEADVKRYQTLEKQIAEFTKQLEKSAEESRIVREQLVRIDEVWRPRVKEMVEKISGRFSELFQVFNAKGLVRLEEAELYRDWAIEIMTCFRPQVSETMQPLSGYRQSGGERSVSTMLYLLALQEVTTAPFRVVDEINQGMDPVNERRIMDILNKECSPQQNREIPQYFVVTPKLLPRLQYSEHSAVYLIYNGLFVTDQSVWQVEEFLKDHRESQEAAQV